MNLTIELIGAYFAARTDEDGETKVTFRIPESSLAEVTRLAVTGRKKALKITIEEHLEL